MENKKNNGSRQNLQTLRGKVAVITGASSGIGRAAAHEYARRGALVVVAARNKQALDEVVKECRSMGSDALAVVTDVTREEEVNNLAQEAIEYFGKFDIWVNNAAVSLFGRFDEVPIADIRQVIETNLFGYIYGSRAALSHFRARSEGILINVSSVVALSGQPYTGAYVATKAAEKALSDSLSQELIDEENIHVCSVIPAVTDTPIFQHAANYSGQEVVPPKPLHSPEKVALAIAKVSENPRKEVFSGAGPITYVAKAITPYRMFDKMVKNRTSRQHFRGSDTSPSVGNLYHHTMDALSGGWKEVYSKERSKRLFQAGVIIAGIGISLAATWLIRYYRREVHSSPSTYNNGWE
jgi:short-subunit dehydrogenase